MTCTAVLNFSFEFLSCPLLSLFFCTIFLFCWAFSELHFGGESLKLLGLEERKGNGTRVDFNGNFRVNVIWFFAFFSVLLDWIVLIVVWFERSFHPAQVSGQSCPWLSKLMTSQMVEGAWILMGICYGWYRGGWDKALMPNIRWKSNSDVLQPMKENLDQHANFVCWSMGTSDHVRAHPLVCQGVIFALLSIVLQWPHWSGSDRNWLQQESWGPGSSPRRNISFHFAFPSTCLIFLSF